MGGRRLGFHKTWIYIFIIVVARIIASVGRCALLCGSTLSRLIVWRRKLDWRCLYGGKRLTCVDGWWSAGASRPSCPRSARWNVWSRFISGSNLELLIQNKTYS